MITNADLNIQSINQIKLKRLRPYTSFGGSNLEIRIKNDLAKLERNQLFVAMLFC